MNTKWYFASGYLAKGFPNESRKLLAVFEGTREESRAQAFEKIGTCWIEYSEEEWADFTKITTKARV